MMHTFVRPAVWLGCLPVTPREGSWVVGAMLRMPRV